MSTFWPADIQLSDTRLPQEILEEAKEEWQTKSDGVMDLIWQHAESESGNPMIMVHAKHVLSNRTASLFSVVHRPDHPYPAAFKIEEESLPNFLKKSYRQSGFASSQSDFSSIADVVGGGRTVSNKWVSETPLEFEEKLADAFNLGSVKSIILNLASVAKAKGKSSDDESLVKLEES